MFGHYLNHTVWGRDWKPRCNLKSSTRKHRHKPNGFIYWMVCVGPLMLAQYVDIALNVHTKRVSIFDRLMCTFRFISTLFCPINVRCVCVYIAYTNVPKTSYISNLKASKANHIHTHARASTFVWHTHSHSIYIKCNWIRSSPIVCLLWMSSMTIYQYLALKSLFLTDDDRTENVRTMNHKSTCNAHHHRLYEVLCISQLCDDFPISGHFLFRFFPICFFQSATKCIPHNGHRF